MATIINYSLSTKKPTQKKKYNTEKPHKQMKKPLLEQLPGRQGMCLFVAQCFGTRTVVSTNQIPHTVKNKMATGNGGERINLDRESKY